MTSKRFYSTGLGLKSAFFNFQVCAVALLVIIHCAGISAQGTTLTNKVEELQSGQMLYFDVVPDPIEGFNRCSWAFNDCLFRGVIYPLSFGYNFVAPKPVRTKISNVGHNLSYPVRFFNSCFQG